MDKRLKYFLRENLQNVRTVVRRRWLQSYMDYHHQKWMWMRGQAELFWVGVALRNVILRGNARAVVRRYTMRN